MLRIRVPRFSRFNRLVPSLLIVAALAAGNFPALAAEGNQASVVSWSNTTPVARYRNDGDWLVDMGRATPQDAYGPFASKRYKQGDIERFNALDFSGPPRKLTANLKLVTEHAYWWFEEGANVNQEDVEKAGLRFEQDIYPLDTKLFGNEWSPGIDGDPRIFILNQKQIGGYAVGVFSPKDECARKFCPQSNQREMIYIGLDYGPPNSPQQLTVISHEFQHLIQYNSDGNEQRWLDEGLAQLAEHLNGFSPRQIASSNLLTFLHYPNFQLNSWPDRMDIDPGVNYAAGYIFSLYLYQRFGTSFIEALSRSPYKGLASIEQTLISQNAPETLDEVFTDWAITNYVNNPYVGDGRYYYQSLKLPRQADAADLMVNAPTPGLLHQYGADYLQVADAGSYSLSFQGDTTTKLTNAQPTSGKWMWWSYNEPRGAARLQREFDLTKAKKPVLNYKAWWDLTSPGSRVYLAASDDGKTWTTLDATSTGRCAIGTDRCYEDHSKAWHKESVDLSDYAGKKVHIRFDYLTEGPQPSTGFFIDDINLPAIGFSDNVETEVAGWIRQGFMRVQSNLPQHWGVNVVSRDNPATVVPMKLDARNSGKINFKAAADGAIVVITAMAPFVETTANYTITLRKTQ